MTQNKLYGESVHGEAVRPPSNTNLTAIKKIFILKEQLSLV
jgi:hypothetical protein